MMQKIVFTQPFVYPQLIISKTCKHLDFPLLSASSLFICAKVDPFSISNVDLIKWINDIDPWLDPVPCMLVDTFILLSKTVIHLGL